MGQLLILLMLKSKSKKRNYDITFHDKEEIVVAGKPIQLKVVSVLASAAMVSGFGIAPYASAQEAGDGQASEMLEHVNDVVVDSDAHDADSQDGGRVESFVEVVSDSSQDAEMVDGVESEGAVDENAGESDVLDESYPTAKEIEVPGVTVDDLSSSIEDSLSETNDGEAVLIAQSAVNVEKTSNKGKAKPTRDEALKWYDGMEEGTDYMPGEVLIDIPKSYEGDVTELIERILGLEPGSVSLLDDDSSIDGNRMLRIKLPDGSSVPLAVADLLGSPDVLTAGANLIYQEDDPVEGDGSEDEGAAKPSREEALRWYERMTPGVDYVANQVMVVVPKSFKGDVAAMVEKALGLEPGSVQLLDDDVYFDGNRMLVFELPDGSSVPLAVADLLGSPDVLTASANLIYQEDDPVEGGGEAESGATESEGGESAEAAGASAEAGASSNDPQPQASSANESRFAITKNVVNAQMGEVIIVKGGNGMPPTAYPHAGDVVTVKASRASSDSKLVRMSYTYTDPQTGEQKTKACKRFGEWKPASNVYTFEMPQTGVTLNAEWASVQ